MVEAKVLVLCGVSVPYHCGYFVLGVGSLLCGYSIICCDGSRFGGLQFEM